MTTATVTPEAMTIPVEQVGLPYAGSLDDALNDSYLAEVVDYFKTEQSQDTAPVELSFDELVEQKAQQFIADVEAYAAAVAQKDVPQDTAKQTQRLRKVRAGVAKCGLALMGVGALVGGFEGVTAAQAMFERTPAVAEAPIATATPTTVFTTLTTIEAPTTTATPETPAKQFEAPVNSVIGTVSIPKLCENIQMWEYDESETPLVGTTQDSGLANGAVKLDTLEPDPNRVTDCKGVDDYTSSHPGYMGRADWKAVTAISPANPSGNVNYYRPVIGHQNANGVPGSVYPGQVGLSIFWGHRSTYSAATKDIEVLEPNDIATVRRADGEAFAYRFTERVQVDPQIASIQLRDYYDAKVAEAKASGQSADISMMVIGGCGDAAGEPGGDASRVFAVFVLAQ